MDGPGIQRRVNLGFRKAAKVAGFAHRLYRPADPMDPLRFIDLQGVVQASFDGRPALNFQIPPLHNDPMRYALIDPDLVEPGDYIIRDDGSETTLFVASKPTFYGAVCVQCNETISGYRTTAAGQFGSVGDRTDLVVTGETALFKGWPVSMLFSGRSRGNVEGIPGDMPDPEYMILMPAIPGVELPRPGDAILDSLGRRFAVGWQESSELGWRIIARLLTAG